MSTIYRLSKTGTKLLYKVRHHRGHGVHSPFVFNLINNVIEEKTPYYSYENLTLFLSQFPQAKLKLNKGNLLAFRLCNYFNAEKILEIGTGRGINTLCLAAPSSSSECIAVETNEEKLALAQILFEHYDRNISLSNTIPIISESTFDCIYINFNNYNSFTPEDLDNLIAMCHEKSFIVAKGIRRNRKQNRLWKRLSAHETRTAELDLFDIGLLFFDTQLYRWKYQISF